MQRPDPDHGARDHDHAAALTDTLAFINTFELDHVTGEPHEHLVKVGDVERWFTARGLMHPIGSEAMEPAAVLRRVHALRAALREVAEAVVEERSARPDALAEVNRALGARAIVELIPTPDGIGVGHRHVGDPIDDALARLADPLVAELTSGRPERIRVCDSETCHWLFYDASPTRRRRWCDMATCGNRAKAARHRARSKGGAAPGGTRRERARRVGRAGRRRSVACLLGSLEQRSHLGRQAGHRLLVVWRREAGDEVSVADLEERREFARRRPPASRPAGRSTVGRRRCARRSRLDAFRLRAGVADDHRPSPVVRSISAGRGRPSRSAGRGSRPCVSRSPRRRRRCSRRRTSRRA
jgi:predicted RNA-binding Zn ribbon-like protein